MREEESKAGRRGWGQGRRTALAWSLTLGLAAAHAGGWSLTFLGHAGPCPVHDAVTHGRTMAPGGLRGVKQSTFLFSMLWAWVRRDEINGYGK